LKSGKFKRVYTETTGYDYARTLAMWNANLEANASKFPPSVVRKYRYYFNFCEVGFGSELLTLSRVVFQKID
jgi:cyclopropane fatty-acyl-phospholipid synthase-like methyltransferase